MAAMVAQVTVLQDIPAPVVMEIVPDIFILSLLIVVPPPVAPALNP